MNLDMKPDTRKVTILLNSIGQNALHILNSFDIYMNEVTLKDAFQRFELLLTLVNITVEIQRLFNCKQEHDEDIESYATDLKNSLQCDIENCPSLTQDVHVI